MVPVLAFGEKLGQTEYQDSTELMRTSLADFSRAFLKS